MKVRELEISAKTVDEATKVALAQLGVSRDEVEIEVIKKGKSGVLGVGAEDAKIRVTLLDDEAQPGQLDDVAETARKVLSDILKAMGIAAEIDVTSSPDENTPVTLNIEGDDLGVLIGRRGQALASLQYLVRLIVAEKSKKWISVNVDVDWYKKRHYETLKKLAQRLAEQVARRKRAITMEPMQPDERRIVHLALADNPDVMTQSTGEGDGRRVVIQMRKR
ncbi:MAG: RNA-binding cell elongation regulator Jag/EloR [Dehalococcoidia bacterium]|jgi:spoIIIJ-associated protein